MGGGVVLEYVPLGNTENASGSSREGGVINRESVVQCVTHACRKLSLYLSVCHAMRFLLMATGLECTAESLKTSLSLF